MTGQTERARRWRLLLGAEAGGGELPVGDDAVLDETLRAVYDTPAEQFSFGPDEGGKPSKIVAQWIDEIQSRFPDDIVNVMINDAIGRHNIESLLLQKDALRAAPRDVHTAAFLLRHKRKIPPASEALARRIVGDVAGEIRRKLEPGLRTAVAGAMRRRSHSPVPSPKALDWHGTIRKNLGRYDAEKRVITPERFLFFERGSKNMELMIALDQSASMAHSAILAAAAAAVLSGIPELRVRLFAFDTSVTEMTDGIGDPAEILFRLRLSGGTDIPKAVDYCKRKTTRPKQTALILISDLRDSEGTGKVTDMLDSWIQSGSPAAVLLPAIHNRQLAENLQKKGALCAVIEPESISETIGKLL
jgi:Mg-chelatase subunit ChlD